MSEPQVPEEVVIRHLTKEEMNAANRMHRARLGRALSRFPWIRLMITQGKWTQDPVTDTVEYPEGNPVWKHIFSRSAAELRVVSEYLGDPGLNSDTLNFLLPEDNPGIGFTKVFQGKVVESPSYSSDVLPAAEVVTSRIEQQFGPKRNSAK